MTQKRRQTDAGPSGASVVQEDKRTFIESHTKEATRIRMGKFMLDKPKPAQRRPVIKSK